MNEHERGFEAGYSAAIHDARVAGSRARAELETALRGEPEPEPERPDESGYNGWTNFETWCVNLWLSNEEPLYREAIERTRNVVETEDERGTPANGVWTLDEAKRYGTADALRDYVRDELAPDLGASFAADLLGSALDSVSWNEVADAFLELVAD